MTKTEHFDLFTWAENDFVDLDQMNANFTQLDAALEAQKQAGLKSDAYARVLACNAANAYLGAAHAGGCVAAAENISLSPFLTEDEVESHSRVFIVGGPHFVPVGGCTLSYMHDSSNEPPMYNGPSSGDYHWGTLILKGYCSSMNYEYSLANGHDAWDGSLRFYRKGVLFYEQPMNHRGADHDRVTLNVAHAFDPNGGPIDVWLHVTSSGTYFGKPQSEVWTPTEVVYSSGELVTKPVSATGFGARLFVRHSGAAAPAVSYKLGDDSWVSLNAAESKPARSASGGSCTLSVYALTFPAAQSAVPLRFRFELTGADACLHDYCAAVF